MQRIEDEHNPKCVQMFLLFGVLRPPPILPPPTPHKRNVVLCYIWMLFQLVPTCYSHHGFLHFHAMAIVTHLRLFLLFKP